MWTLAFIAGAALAIFNRWRRSQLGWGDFVVLHGARVYSRLWHRWSSNRPAPFPLQGPALVIANHTCSADPAFLLAGCKRPLSFLVAREHYHVHPWIRRLLDHLQCVGVTRTGQDPVAARRALRHLEQGLAVCLFPEGNLSGVARGRLLAPKHGIGFLALYSRAPVYPVHIGGGPQTEELLHSWVWPAVKAVHVTFGEAIDLSAYYDRPITRQLIEEVTNLVMESVKLLRGELW